MAASMPILRCPRTGEVLSRTGDVLVSQHNGTKFEYPILDGTPVLIDFDHSVLEEDRTIQQSASSVIERKSYRGPLLFIKHLLSPRKQSTRGNVGKLVELLRDVSKPARVLIVGGGSIGQGMDPLYADPSIHLYSFDIYASPYVQFIADAHQIPLPDEYFDAIVVQAVLEHVLQPAEVVAEIWRVLKFDGLVYAETPFMPRIQRILGIRRCYELQSTGSRVDTEQGCICASRDHVSRSRPIRVAGGNGRDRRSILHNANARRRAAAVRTYDGRIVIGIRDRHIERLRYCVKAIGRRNDNLVGSVSTGIMDIVMRQGVNAQPMITAEGTTPRGAVTVQNGVLIVVGKNSVLPS